MGVMGNGKTVWYFLFFFLFPDEIRFWARLKGLFTLFPVKTEWAMGPTLYFANSLIKLLLQKCRDILH